MRLLFFVTLLLTSACASQQVSVTTPTTPPENGQVVTGGSVTTAPSSTNTVDPVPARVAESDTTARPPWLKARITEVLAERKRNPITRILRYDYEGRKVYYISAPCCDQFSNVYDTQGKLICQPDGGITGKGDGKCPDFDKRKTNEKLVWQDPR
ncbi:DUF6970 domain-containing protein [Hymenobacter monticola]|uniref:DUF6970 domain-containing protein n=1 Tax=Hymenobacter monticola TaxID=1705399 RepID=A0ABY4B7Q1_9BACT|nr:hypothetical protein [Hymenobacter monticola]UOE35198.1 hypothetical protein MTP16_05985 [Hymenobacter monticola]